MVKNQNPGQTSRFRNTAKYSTRYLRDFVDSHRATYSIPVDSPQDSLAAARLDSLAAARLDSLAAVRPGSLAAVRLDSLAAARLDSLAAARRGMLIQDSLTF